MVKNLEGYLEGKRFFTNDNNGVYAIIALEDHLDRIKAKKIRSVLLGLEQSMLQHMYQGPIFTFARLDSLGLARSPWLTGNKDDYEAICAHIADEGGSVAKDVFYVPFSNAYETGVHGQEKQREELAYVTTTAQFVETFGATIGEIVHRTR